VVKYGGTDALLIQHNYGTSVQCFMLIYVKQALQFDASQITPQQAAALREGKNIQVSSP
jgi:hypothetical protein